MPEMCAESDPTGRVPHITGAERGDDLRELDHVITGTAPGLVNDLGRTHNGENCIRFRRVDTIDLDVFAEAVGDAVEWGEDQEERIARRCARPV